MKHLSLWKLLLALTLVFSLLVGCSGTPTPPPTPIPTSTPEPTPTIPARRALFVIFSLFEETEYKAPRGILENKGFLITVASSSTKAVSGSKGTKVQPDLKLSEVRVADYEVIVFIGGYGYETTNPDAIRIAQEAVAQDKLLAAICIAPITLAKAGVLKGKKATTSLPRTALEAEGAIFTGALVEQDGLIITANGPAASSSFGYAISNALNK